MKKIQSIRGMPDVLPGDSANWRWVEDQVAGVLDAHGYRQIRLPLLEFTDLFARGVGETSDIVEREMYTFRDRGDDLVTLRPEGTAGCVRACEEHGLLFNQVQRLWYSGPMFRYERPQKGRYRQFEQIGVECFGLSGPDIDAELILMNAAMWQALGISDVVQLELGTLGTTQSRLAHRAALIDYLEPRAADLDDDSRNRLQRNPLRIFDSKVERTREIMADAPLLPDFLDDESRRHFDTLCATLDACGVKTVINPRLVRGLDYYTGTVFEWTTDALGAQGTVCGGGRYDRLVEQLGGRPTPAIGFAMGVDRLLLLASEVGDLAGRVPRTVDGYVIPMSDAEVAPALRLATRIRAEVPGLRLQLDCGGGKMRKRFKRADDSGAEFALVLGPDEVAGDQVSLKPLRAQGEQRTLASEALIAELRAGDGKSA